MSNDNKNNGLITKIWGGPTWVALHSITFGYPINPTEEQKETYFQYFNNVGDVLPCRYCRESYKEFINEDNTNYKLTMDVMKNRETLTKWLYYLHNRINKKLGVDYRVTYNDVVNRYEAYRAKCSKKIEINIKQKGCVMPLNLKANSYSIAERKDCPVISFDTALKCIQYAKDRGLEEEHFSFINNIKITDKFNELLNNKESELWINRNKKASDIMKHMRNGGIKSLEQDGKWKGFPTIEETKLILLSSSFLPCDELNKILSKLPKKGGYKRYKLTK